MKRGIEEGKADGELFFVLISLDNSIINMIELASLPINSLMGSGTFFSGIQPYVIRPMVIQIVSVSVIPYCCFGIIVPC